MKSFLVTLLFQIEIEGHEGKAQFDEQVRLIEATDKKTAWSKAQILGRNEETSFVNQSNQLVRWRFIQSVNIFPISGLSDGAQVFSITHETENERWFKDELVEKSKLAEWELLNLEMDVS